MSEKAFHLDPTDPRTDQLILFLKDRGWLTRAQIAQALGWDPRLIRAVVRATRGEIIAGQKGYRLNIQTAQEDLEKSHAQIRSQIKDNSERLSDQIYVQHHGTRRPHLFRPTVEPKNRELDLFATAESGGYGSGL